MAESSVSYVLSEDNGRKFTIRGTGATIAEARAEAASKLALTVGAAVKASEVQNIAAVPGGGAGTYSDANIILRKGEKTVSVHLENIANSLAEVVDGVTSGRLAPDSCAAFAAAYRDGNGDGGYIFHEGFYNR